MREHLAALNSRDRANNPPIKINKVIKKKTKEIGKKKKVMGRMSSHNWDRNSGGKWRVAAFLARHRYLLLWTEFVL